MKYYKNEKIPDPSVKEVEYYLNNWEMIEHYSSQERAIVKLFKSVYKYNTDINDILVKVSVLNDFYSTNIFSPYTVAKHILELDIDMRLENGDLNLVNEISFNVMSNGNTKNFYSFASKYCSHHNTDVYPIYDSNVDRMLCYFRNIDGFYKFKNADLKDYVKFKEILLKFRSSYKLDKFSLKDIDKYLWQLGKAAKA